MDGRVPILLVTLAVVFGGDARSSSISSLESTLFSQDSSGQFITGQPFNRAISQTKSSNQNASQNTGGSSTDEAKSLKLCDIAQASTVKVISGKSWGSGVIIQQQGSLYTLLTNEHVVEPKISNYSVVTVDSNSHQAQVLKRFHRDETNGSDLALLQFRSVETYKPATLAEWTEGEKVFAFGFPVDANSAVQKGFLCTPLVAVGKLPRSMKEGYQLGYQLGGKIGMSGGPLLNERGQVVGINGKAQPAIFNNADLYRYRDGSPVKDISLDVLSQYSWAIPINQEMLKAFPTQLGALAIVPKASPVAISPQSGTQVEASPTSASNTAVQPLSEGVPQASSASTSSAMQVVNGTGSQQLQPQGMSNSSPQSTSTVSPATSSQVRKGSTETILTVSQLNAVAQSITVGLTSQTRQSSAQNKGVSLRSGVLIGKQNSTYYVLTTSNSPDLQDQYEVLTFDRNRYIAKVIDQQPSLGLIVLQFTSSQAYKVATVDTNYQPKATDLVYVGGLLSSGQTIKFTLIEGESVDAKALHLGSNLIYTNRVTDQLSGGPIFNQYGRLVGIHKALRPEGGIREGIPITAFLKVVPTEIRKALVSSPLQGTVSCNAAFLGSCTP